MAEAAQNLELSHRAHETSAMTDVDQERAIMEVQGAMVIAKRFPRDQKTALDRILNACTRQTLAEVALYEYSRGGTPITGPSIRLAEAIAQNWGNLQFGIREIEQRHGYSVVEAFAWDIETNTRQLKTFQVAHKRHTKKGAYMLEDPRDIYEMVANQGARRLRACILGVIPGDVVEAAVNQCENTLKTREEVTPEKVKAMIDAFAAFGVTKEQIEKRIQRRMDAITPALMVNLRKIYNSLKDGMSGPEDWFEVAEPNGQKPEPGSLQDRLNRAKNGSGSAESDPPSGGEPNGSGGGDGGDDDPSRGRNDDIRHPDESLKLSEFRRRINAEIEKALGPIELDETEISAIWEVVEKFVLEVAEAHNMTEDDVKMSSVDDWEGFRKILMTRLDPVFETFGVSPASGKTETPKASEGEDKTAPRTLDTTETRKEFIYIKTADSLATYVWKNIERIEKEFSPDLLEELRAKWKRTVSDGAEFPPDKRAKVGASTGNGSPNGSGNGKANSNGNRSIVCPKKHGARVFPEVCERKCADMRTCDAYARFKETQAPGPENAGNGKENPDPQNDDLIWCSQYGKYRPPHECAEGCPLDPHRCKAYVDRFGRPQR